MNTSNVYLLFVVQFWIWFDFEVTLLELTLGLRRRFMPSKRPKFQLSLTILPFYKLGADLFFLICLTYES